MIFRDDMFMPLYVIATKNSQVIGIDEETIEILEPVFRIASVVGFKMRYLEGTGGKLHDIVFDESLYLELISEGAKIVAAIKKIADRMAEMQLPKCGRSVRILADFMAAVVKGSPKKAPLHTINAVMTLHASLEAAMDMNDITVTGTEDLEKWTDDNIMGQNDHMATWMKMEGL
jgi:hypothetical protein